MVTLIKTPFIKIMEISKFYDLQGNGKLIKIILNQTVYTLFEKEYSFNSRFPSTSNLQPSDLLRILVVIPYHHVIHALLTVIKRGLYIKKSSFSSALNHFFK
jgi:hypothetical protein